MIPLVYQSSYFDCARACALMIAPDLKPPKPNLNGLTPKRFAAWAEASGLLVRQGDLSIEDLVPGSIVLIEKPGEVSHYVVVTRVSRTHVHVNDPWDGRKAYPKKTFRSILKWGMICRSAT